jgi:hypothetical protein
MKKLFFFKEYEIYSEFETKAIRGLATIEVDFDQLGKDLPLGAEIRPETVRTQIEGSRFIVYGEYVLPATILETVAKEAIELDDLLGDQEKLPSVN